jgi:hypothetical protein
MTRAASSLENPVHDANRSNAWRGLKGALAVVGVAALLSACADAGDNRRGGGSAAGAAASQQGAGVVSGAGGGAVGGGIGGSAGASTATPGTTGGGDIGTPVTPDTTSKVPPTTR